MATRLAIFFVRCYQTAVSPLMGANCRFVPTCSQYAIEALRKDGFCRGGWKSLKRICRCHPFNPGGYDPP